MGRGVIAVWLPNITKQNVPERFPILLVISKEVPELQ